MGLDEPGLTKAAEAVREIRAMAYGGFRAVWEDCDMTSRRECAGQFEARPALAALLQYRTASFRSGTKYAK